MSLPPLPAGLKLASPDRDDAPSPPRRRSSPRGSVRLRTGERVRLDPPTGDAHDGDTFRLRDGRNARLFGVDAFELDQTGRARDGSTVPLGAEARRRLLAFAQPDARVTGTGDVTYGRPVASLERDGDAATALLDAGLGIATPEYLRGNDDVRARYMEAERLARLNRRGAWQTQFEQPSSYRHGTPDPWAKAQPGSYGDGEAVFWDEPTPFQGLRPEIAEKWVALHKDPASTADDIVAFAKTNGFNIDAAAARKFIANRNAEPGARISDAVVYGQAPRVLTDSKDGATGATMRGVADPINMLDEVGAVVDTLGGTSGRESLWNSDRRFGDILANNLDQNRSILAFDDAYHPYARFGGQLAGGLVVPGASVERVGAAAATKAIEGGAGRFVADQAARKAVVRRLSSVGGIESATAGFGQGEDWQSRAQGALIAGPIGVVLGAGTGLLAPKAAQLGRRIIDFSSAKLPAGARRAIRQRRGLDPAEGRFGTIHYNLASPKRWSKALDRMREDDAGEIPNAIQHPEIGNVDLVWGTDKFGVKHIAEQHPEVLDDLPRLVERLPVKQRPEDVGNNRYVLEDATHRAIVAPDFDGETKRWVVTAYEKKAPEGADISPRSLVPDGGSTDAGAGVDVGGSPAPGNPRQIDQLAYPRFDLPPEGATPAERVLTAAPVRPAPPARTLNDVQPDIDAWAASQGATPHEADTLPDVMLHGSPRPDIDQFDPYGRGGYGLFGAGTYLTDSAQIAASYSNKGLSRAAKEAAVDRTLYAVRQAVKNPLDMDAPANRATWETAAKRVMGDWSDGDFFGDVPPGATNERMWREVEEILSGDQITMDEGRETMDAFVRSLGHDGITHVGGGRVGKDGPRHRVVIALDPEQTEIVDRLSVGSLMQPPGPRNPDWIDIEQHAAGRAGSVERLRGFIDAEVARRHMVRTAPEAAPRTPDRIDVTDRPRPLLDPSTDAERARQAQDVMPTDVLPLPSNQVASIEEAGQIAAGRIAPIRAPNERDELGRRNIPSPRDATRTLPKRGPLDLVTWLRTQGGIRAQGSELEHYGIGNAPRQGMDFAGGENRFGPLVSNEGMTYDDAAHAAWEAGFFPDHVDRPSITEFLDTLNATHTGRNRAFRPDDLGEVDAFERARRQRHAVEAAKQEGAPLYEDRSQPVGMDDLDGNSPPIEAYEEWGENAPNLAGNIRLDKLDSPQAIKRALIATHDRVGGFDAATRGRITHAETERLASEMGLTADDLLKRRKGQAFNAEEALAARQILARSATDLVNMARRLQRVDNPGEELEAAFKGAWLRHVAIQEQVAGATAEAGRALSAFRMAADARAVDRVLPSLGDIAGGAARLKDVADKLVDLELTGVGPGGVNSFAAKALKPRFRDKLIELYYNSLLSGPQTHAVNIMSNTLTALGQLPEHAVAASVGAVRKMLPRQAATDRVLFSELGARTVGLIQGTREGLRQAARTFKTGEPADAVTKVEQQTMRAIGGIKGSVIRTPTRALAAEDELFKAMARRMELSGLAVRGAAKEGLKGTAARDRAADLLANPSDDMLRQSFEYGRYLTFQNPLGPVGRHISAITETWPGLKLIVPFVRTPTNILKFAIERSPAAPVLKEWRRDIVAGGAKRDLAIAKLMVGTGIGATMVQMAAEGRMTGGGPADDSARRLLIADGWQPYSFKAGGRYYSYSRLDPYSTLFGTAADLVDLQSHLTEKQKQDVPLLIGTAVLHNLANKTWLSGLSTALEAINDPDRSLEAFVSRTAGAIAVPAIVAQSARIADPILREARSPLDRIRSRFPGASDGLAARRDVFGQRMVSEGGLGPDIVAPIYTTTDKADPTIAALLKAETRIGLPSRKVGSRQLTPEEYSEYQRLAGGIAKPLLDSLVRDASWKRLNDEDQQDAVDKLMKRARAGARSQLFGGIAANPASNRSAPPRSADVPALPSGLVLGEQPKHRRRRKLPELPAGLALSPQP